eukprot:CAMPEP_0170542758 /NCGR_PEP_ID=MMETSP0211-20121228/2095_1 /TAXON_ID=311385 /ORGANISM="Pseudokeronopsis sp., Strain OXSARD2" /LENGTH=107 /DNA_ID=CAMNT_0010845929 /DNA_START=66 /DNA_END=388 /DNA_ORIENTATION=-
MKSAGDDVLLSFKIKGKADSFHQEIFKQGQTFEWVKNKVAIALEARYADLSLHYNGKRIPEPFCLVDMGITSQTELEVQIAEGAHLGLDEVKQIVAKELEESGEQGS